LRLTEDEGRGKDDPPFDPFEDERLRRGYVEFDELLAEGEEEMGMMESGGEPLSDDVAEEGAEDEDDDEEYSEDEDDDEDEDEEELELDPEDVAFRSLYNTDGSPLRPKSQLASLKSGMPSGGSFAVVSLAGIQHKVHPDDLIVSNKLRPVSKWAVGRTLTLRGEEGEVLMVGSTHLTLVGVPNVRGAEVDVLVEEIGRDAKILVFKKRRRKNSQRRRGFRREVTMLRVLDVRFPERYEGHERKARV